MGRKQKKRDSKYLQNRTRERTRNSMEELISRLEQKKSSLGEKFKKIQEGRDV